MNAHPGFANPGVRTGEATGPVGINETFWGYAIRSGATRDSHAAMAEVLANFLGFTLILASVGQWALPGALYGAEVIGMKVGVTAVFSMIGVLLAWYAHRGFTNEIQIDIMRREVRSATTNRKGAARIGLRLPFDGIESAFVQRSKGDRAPARLYVRLLEMEEVFEIASGSEAAMMSLHARLARDLKPRGTVETTIPEELQGPVVRRIEPRMKRLAGSR